jgi:hypothetical protein
MGGMELMHQFHHFALQFTFATTVVSRLRSRLLSFQNASRQSRSREDALCRTAFLALVSDSPIPFVSHIFLRRCEIANHTYVHHDLVGENISHLTGGSRPQQNTSLSTSTASSLFFGPPRHGELGGQQEWRHEAT